MTSNLIYANEYKCLTINRNFSLHEVCADDQHPSLCIQTMCISITISITISIVIIVYVISRYNCMTQYTVWPEILAEIIFGESML